jgi:hypothetical protein
LGELPSDSSSERVYLKLVGRGSQITLAAKGCSLVINKMKVNERSRENWNAAPYGKVSAKHICTGNTQNVKKTGNTSNGKSIFYFVLKSGGIRNTLDTRVIIRSSERRAILNYPSFCTTTSDKSMLT